VGNYTYNETEDPNDDQRIRRPRHTANLGFDIEPINRLTIHANLRIVKDNEDQIFGVGRVKLDDYNALQASINWAATSQLDLYVRGENLLNDDYQEVTSYNTSKAAVYAGARFHFR
jgi:vitamin B12 transporter